MSLQRESGALSRGLNSGEFWCRFWCRFSVDRMVLLAGICFESAGAADRKSAAPIFKNPRFSGFSGAGSGAGLYLNLVRFGATRCDVENKYNYMIVNNLFDAVRGGAQGCFKPQKWTQNPPRATSWGFDPPSRHHKISNLAHRRFQAWSRLCPFFVHPICECGFDLQTDCGGRGNGDIFSLCSPISTCSRK